MTIHTLKALKDNYIYVLSAADGEAAVIDPGEAGPVLEFVRANQLRLTTILCTHHHWDHVDGVGELVQATGANVFCSDYDFERIAFATHRLRENETLKILDSEMRVIAVPGHTLGQIALWFPSEKALFAGDTIFSGGCGRLFEGTFAQMFESLGKIKTLPSDTQLYFGHEYSLNNFRFIKSRGVNTPDLDRHQADCENLLADGKPATPGLLSIEMKVNPFLYSKNLEEFSEWREARNHW